MDEFQENILDHYRQPRNFGEPSWTPTHTARLQNLSCGDELTFYLQIKNGIVQKVMFNGQGCSITIASASMFSEHIIGKDITELRTLEATFTATNLLHISLTASRFKCSTLAQETVQSALHESLK